MFWKREKRSYTASVIGGVFSSVNDNEAMNIPAVYQAVTLISNAVASVRVLNSPIKQEPQENITLYNFLNTITRNILLHGNAFVKRTSDGFTILDPKNVTAFYDNEYFFITYYQHGVEKIQPEDMLHFRNVSKDNLGQMGYSSLVNFSDSFKKIHVMSEYEKNYMKNASRPSLWIKSLKNLAEDKLAELKKAFKKTYQGAENSGSVPVLSDGLELMQLNNSNTLVDADLTKLKEASLKEIASIFNLPVSMLDNSLANYSNAVEANLQFLKMTINPILNNIKSEINLKLSSNMDFDTSSFLEGSFEQKVQTLVNAISGGLLTANEARKRLGYKETQDGSVLYAPAGTPTTQGKKDEV